MNNKITVSSPFLPPLEEFIPYLKQIWNNKILTNNGEFHKELEQKLCDYLDVKYISLLGNGMNALEIALKVLGLEGEVITTPYSFVATTNSIKNANLTPVFVDVEENTCNINANKIEEAITQRTKAILPVHTYGTPCNVFKIQEIAEKNNLKIIYDAAHAFGIKLNNKNILNFGDLSILSFHATKIFTTFEGGAIVSHTLEMKNKIDRFKNFGIIDEVSISSCGTNSKMSEVNAAFGLLQLKYIDTTMSSRIKIAKRYKELLIGIKGIRLQSNYDTATQNGSYFPIFIEKDYWQSRDELHNKLTNKGIMARRYFYPLLSNLTVHKDVIGSNCSNLPIANALSNSVLCLPLHTNMDESDVEYITSLIANNN
jgi:dTDP-4-amino-4,6-dideoxygalactose transaminase